MNRLLKNRIKRKIHNAIIAQANGSTRMAPENQDSNFTFLLEHYPHTVRLPDARFSDQLEMRAWCIERMGEDGLSYRESWIGAGYTATMVRDIVGSFAIIPKLEIAPARTLMYRSLHGMFKTPDDAFEFKIRWG
ncbi:MAG: hypothetical protein EOP83_26765 [Verrucomicrobiaceae bacterium]|nr:MAG: hypothetical protein EOP83_26765 [Verrucomicrobiaceae bacterium]